MSSPLRNLTTERKTPVSRFRASERWLPNGANTGLQEYMVKEYLARYPNLLEEFLLDNVSTDFLKGVLEKVKKKPIVRKPVLDRQQEVVLPTGTFSGENFPKLSEKILTSAKDEEMCNVVNEMCQMIGYHVKADSFCLYLIKDNGIDVSIYKPGEEFQNVGPVGKNMTVSAHIAHEKKALNVTDLQQDSRFPKGICLGDDTTHQVIGIPILFEDGRCCAVAEFCRGWRGNPFSSEEFEFTVGVFSWINACVQKMKISRILRVQKSLNKFLLEATRVLFDDVCNIDHLIDHIMIYTKELVSADRCAIFLIDDQKGDLYANVFDEGEVSEKGVAVFTRKPEIRFPKGCGIAGHVAVTGKVVNIKDAYKDERFNPEIDKKTGYHTKNILCMPISGKNGIIGVVQMINRLGDNCFTPDDEEAFEMFAVYCALALQYSKLYNILTKEELMHTVAQEVLEFLLPEKEEEAVRLASKYYIEESALPVDFYKFDFCAYDNVKILPMLFIRMVHDTFGDMKFDLGTLCRFVLAVRKNYRPITYHNWEHGFHVAHAIWRMIKTCDHMEITPHEKMALIFGAICHDIDHRGFNNDFYKKKDHPIASLYSSSCMEFHHYQQTIKILQIEGHEIFSFLKKEEYDVMLERIKKCILATDLALYFGNQGYLSGLLEKNEFTADNPAHRDALFAIMMTGADICAVPKPWRTMDRTIDYLYDEFWMQGEEEKKLGLKPMAMMDRDHKSEIPNQQIGFINFICKPCYKTLSTLLPMTKPLLQGCDRTEANWKRVIKERQEKDVKAGK